MLERNGREGGQRGVYGVPPHGADMCNDDPCGVTSHSIAAPQLASASLSLAGAFSSNIYSIFVFISFFAYIKPLFNFYIQSVYIFFQVFTLHDLY